LLFSTENSKKEARKNHLASRVDANW